MTSLEDVFQEFYPQFVKILPTHDAIFMANLYANRFLPGDTKGMIQAKPTRSEKNTYFLDECIKKGFYPDKNVKGGFSNPILEQLLTVMEKCDDLNVKGLASRFRDEVEKKGLSHSEAPRKVASVYSAPDYNVLIKLFEEVAEWDKVCPHLLDDRNGEKTHGIQLNNQTLDQRKSEMLRTYIKSATPPTWNDIINALEKGGYRNLAAKIKTDLQGN